MLVIHIAHTEDAARYQGPVTFWNSQLSETLGFKSPKQPNNARQGAIDNGWLIYERSHDRTVGKYWTSNPKSVERFNDEPIEENDFNSANGKHSENGTGSGTHGGTGSGKPPNPDPIPDPIHAAHVLAFDRKHQDSSTDSLAPTKPKRKHASFDAEFLKWYPNYPRDIAKRDAEKAFPIAIKNIVTENGISRDEALGWLITRTIEYANSVEGAPPDKIKYPGGWLNGKRYNDQLTVNTSARGSANSLNESDRIPKRKAR